MENRRYSSTAVGFPIRNDLSTCKPKQKKRIPRGHAHTHTHTRGGLLYSGVHEKAMHQNRRKNKEAMHQNRRKNKEAMHQNRRKNKEAMHQNRRKNKEVMHQNRRKHQTGPQGFALRAPLLLGLPPQTLLEINQKKTNRNASESSEE